MSTIFKRRVGDSSSSYFSCSDVHLAPFIVGIICVTVGLVDMIVLFLVPFFKIQDAKKKYPTETFGKPSIPIIVIHFLLHLCLIFLGIVLILISLNVSLPKERIWVIVSVVLVLVFWIAEIAAGLSLTKNPKAQILVDDLLSNLNKDHPSNLIFIYTHHTYQKRSCSGGKKSKCTTHTYHCYSKTGVRIPIQSELIPNPYDFSRAPALFYIDVSQVVNMSNSLSNYLRRSLSAVNGCDSYKKEIEYHPMVIGNYIVSSDKVPVGLNKHTRVASIILGVAVYYELYSKSVPRIDYVQRFKADIVETYNYEGQLTKFSCQQYGKCSTSNSKPSP